MFLNDDRVCIVADSALELMISIHLRTTLLENLKNVDLVLTDQTIDSETLYRSGRQAKVFRNIYYIHVRKIMSLHIWAFEPKYLSKIILESYIQKLPQYDIFISSEYADGFSNLAYYKLKKKNEQLRGYILGEGYFGLEPFSIEIKKRLSDKKRSTRFCLYMQEAVAIISMRKDLVKSHLPVIEMPIFSKNSLSFNSMNKFWNYRSNHKYKKVIIFEESYFYNGEKVNDYELIENIVKVVGENNVTIRLHPRNRYNRFSELNVDVIHDNIPWELTMLNEDMNGKWLVSIRSGSVIDTAIFMDELNIHRILLYNLVENANANEYGRANTIERIVNKQRDDFIVPKNVKELNEFLCKI